MSPIPGGPGGEHTSAADPAGRPLVSVVVPTRNRARRLRETLASICAQTYPDLEIVVVDDASTDGTIAAIESAVEADARVRLLRIPRRAGAAVARNRGIAVSRGSLIAFSDDDCIWDRDKIERQVAALGERDVAVLSPARIVGPDGTERVIGSRDPRGPGFEDHFFKHGVPGPPVFLVRRDALLRAGGFDESLPRLQDIDLWLRLYRAGSFGFVPEPLVRTCWIAGGISTRADALVTACALVDGKHSGPGGMLRRQRALLRRGFAHTLLLEGAYGAGVRYLWGALTLAPSVRGLGSLLVGLGGPAAYRMACGILERRTEGGRA